MILRDLKQAVAGCTLHDLTPVNVDGVDAQPGGIVFSFEQSEIECERDELKADLDRAHEQIRTLERQLGDVGDELKSANALLIEIKDRGRGPSLLDYRNRAEQADLRAAGWKKAYDGMDKELSALRKRKGMLAALYANQAAVIGLLRDAQAGRPIDASAAKELCAKITDESR